MPEVSQPQPNRRSYLAWSKTHPTARFDLSGSGITSVTLEELSLSGISPALEVPGAYGQLELINAIASRYGCPRECVVPVPGASSANFIAMAAIAERGRRVLIETPVYEPILRVAEFLEFDVVPLTRQPAENFVIDLNELEEKLRQAVAAVVLANLHNPSGRLACPRTMASIAALCAKKGAMLMVDEVYLDAAAIVAHNSAWTSAALSDHVVATSSLTKVYGLSGLRIGWLIGNEIIAARAREIMDLLSVHNAAPSSALAVHAFSSMERLEQRYRDVYNRGRRLFVEWVQNQSDFLSYPNDGALFELLRLPDTVTSRKFCEELTREHDTAAAPGAFFGLDDHIRIGLMVEEKILSEGLARLSACVRAATS